jgi:hypothetical protein
MSVVALSHIAGLAHALVSVWDRVHTMFEISELPISESENSACTKLSSEERRCP